MPTLIDDTNDLLLLRGPVLQILQAALTAAIGCMVLALSVTGWFRFKLAIWTRALLFVAAVLFIIPTPMYYSFIGAGLTALALFADFALKRIAGKAQAV